MAIVYALLDTYENPVTFHEAISLSNVVLCIPRPTIPCPLHDADYLIAPVSPEQRREIEALPSGYQRDHMLSLPDVVGRKSSSSRVHLATP